MVDIPIKLTRGADHICNRVVDIAVVQEIQNFQESILPLDITTGVFSVPCE